MLMAVHFVLNCSVKLVMKCTFSNIFATIVDLCLFWVSSLSCHMAKPHREYLLFLYSSKAFDAFTDIKDMAMNTNLKSF